MRNLVPLLMAAILSLSFISKEQTLTLQELYNNPAFEVEVKSNGEHSGKSVLLSIKSTAKNDVNLIVPSGTLFFPEKENEQTLTAPREQLMMVEKNQTNEFKLYGFCTESSDRSPSEGGGFKVGLNNNEKLIKLLKFFKENSGINKYAVQEAIWCVTDNQSISNVYSENSETNKKLKKALSEITGQEIPWHTNKRNLTTDNNGYIIATPIEIVGEIIFNTTEKTTLRSKVVNENGDVVFPNDNKFEIPRALKNVKLDFKVKVNGWEKGKYYVIYYTEKGETILKKEFTV